MTAPYDRRTSTGCYPDITVAYTIDATFQGTTLNNVAEITGDDGDDEDSTPDNDVPEEDDQDDVDVEIGQTYGLGVDQSADLQRSVHAGLHGILRYHGHERRQPLMPLT